jgi:hypothetical protein
MEEKLRQTPHDQGTPNTLKEERGAQSPFSDNPGSKQEKFVEVRSNGFSSRSLKTEVNEVERKRQTPDQDARPSKAVEEKLREIVQPEEPAAVWKEESPSGMKTGAGMKAGAADSKQSDEKLRVIDPVGPQEFRSPTPIADPRFASASPPSAAAATEQKLREMPQKVDGASLKEDACKKDGSPPSTRTQNSPASSSTKEEKSGKAASSSAPSGQKEEKLQEATADTGDRVFPSSSADEPAAEGPHSARNENPAPSCCTCS